MSVRRLSQRAVAAVLSGSLALAACGSPDSQPSATGTNAATTSVPATTTTGVASTTTAPVEDTVFSGDDFYAAPEPDPDAEHGDLVYAQPLELQGMDGVQGWRILYRSQRIDDDQMIAVSGMVFAPAEPATTPRGVVAWAHGTVGMADSCAPSKTFTGRPRTDSVAEATTIAQFADLIGRGYVVVASDYEGLGTDGPHPFLVGESEGRGVLDSLLAVRQMTTVGAGDDAVIYGLSQGGQAALFAGQLAAEWAPSIDVVGVVAAAPFSEVDLLLPLAANISSVFFYYVMGVYGQIAANPALNAEDVLDRVAIENRDVLEDECTTTLPGYFEALATAENKATFMVSDPTTLDDWGPQLESIRPGQSVTGSPVFVAQGLADPTVPAVTTQALVQRLCAIDTVSYREYADVGHGEVIRAANDDILAFIDDRLAGREVAATC